MDFTRIEMSSGTLNMGGRKFVVVEKAEYDRLKQKARQRIRTDKKNEPNSPSLPRKLPSGNYPALEYVRASIARDIIRDRKTRGWSQEELARRAGIRRETLGRIETGKHTPTKRVLDKIDAALEEE
jgi:ribosome-binding protein aMBF1 (putative translation factor)